MTYSMLPYERLNAEPAKRRDTRSAQRRETFVVAIAAILAEAGLTAVVSYLPGLWVLGLLGHCLVSGLVILWASRMRQRRRARRFPALLAIATTTLGLAGAVGILFAALGQRLYRGQARSFQEWYYTLFPPRTRRTARAWYDLSKALGDEEGGGIESFTDLIRYGEIDQKLAIVALLARRFDPRFAPALLAALNDPDPTVRVQAATAAAHIEDDFVERWLSAQRRADARKGDADARLELAELLDAYAFTGILDERRESELRRDAEQHYSAVLDIDTDHDKARIRLGRLRLRTGQPERALEALDPLRQRLSPEAAGWLMEALFRLGRFDELRSIIAQAPEGVLPGRIADAAALWRPQNAQGAMPTETMPTEAPHKEAAA